MSEESIGIDGVGNLMPAVRSLIVKHKAGQTGTGGFYSDIHIAVGKNPIRHEDGSGGTGSWKETLLDSRNHSSAIAFTGSSTGWR